MDCSIKKLANFFQGLPVYFGEIAQNLIIVCSSQEKSLNIFIATLTEFNVIEKVPCLIFEQF